MEIIKLIIVLLAITVLLKYQKPLWIAMGVATILLIICYQIPVLSAGEIAFQSVISYDTITLVLLLYLVTLLQRFLSYTNDIIVAQQSMSSFFNNRRLNLMIAPAFIGLLPSASASYIAGDIVKNTVSGDMEPEEQACITSYFRHLPESFLPTYSGVLMAIQISGMSVSSYIIGMIPAEIAMIAIGYYLYIRKISPETGLPKSEHRGKDFWTIIKSLWTIIIIVTLILVFDMNVNLAVGIVIILYIIINHVPGKNIFLSLKSAFEWKIILNTFWVMIFKDMLTETGVLATLPDYFTLLPLPLIIVFIILFYVCTIISGSTAAVAMCMPLAFIAIPDVGLPLLVTLMIVTFAGSQLSPSHICLFIIAEHFKISFWQLLKKVLPLSLLVVGFAVIYYYVLILIV